MNAYCNSKTLECHNSTNNLRCNCLINHSNKNEIRSLTNIQDDFFQVVIGKASSNKPFECHNHLPKMIGVKDGLLIRHTLNDYYYDKSCHKVDSIEDIPKKWKRERYAPRCEWKWFHKMGKCWFWPLRKGGERWFRLIYRLHWQWDAWYISKEKKKMCMWS